MCGCIELVNAKLKEDNLELDVALFITPGKVPKIILPVKKINRSKKGTIPIYTCPVCPICGKKYEDS